MKTIRILVPLLLSVLLSGCKNVDWFKPKNPQAPPLITTGETPTLEQLTSAINRNSLMVRNMMTEDATIMVPGVLFQLRSRITFERPKRLRVQAGVGMTGQELDFGSNDDLFWIWVRRNPSQETWYCRHDQFPTSPLRNMVPIEPDWIIEALGITEFLPTDRHEGPFQTEDGNLMIVTRKQTAAGVFVKKTTLGAKTGWVLRQEMYSPQNELVALSVSRDHRYDQVSGILYAQRIDVQCQGAEGKMTIDLGTPKFNAPVPFASSMFTMPTFDGFKPVDLCSAEFFQQHGAILPLSGNAVGAGATSSTIPTGQPIIGTNPSANPAPQPFTSPGATTFQNPTTSTITPTTPNGGGQPAPVSMPTNNPGPYQIPESVLQSSPSSQPAASPAYFYNNVTPEANIQTVVR